MKAALTKGELKAIHLCNHNTAPSTCRYNAEKHTDRGIIIICFYTDSGVMDFKRHLVCNMPKKRIFFRPCIWEKKQKDKKDARKNNNDGTNEILVTTALLLFPCFFPFRFRSLVPCSLSSTTWLHAMSAHCCMTYHKVGGHEVQTGLRNAYYHRKWVKSSSFSLFRWSRR